jgi:restriction system protein
VGVVLAPIVFVALGLLSGIESPAVVRPGNVSGVVAHQFVTIVARIFQWLIPLLLLIGSAVLAIERRKRIKLYGEVVTSSSPSALNRMSWQDFERLVSGYFQRLGFRVTETGGSRPDGGVDLIANRGNDEYVVQCKQ